MHDLLTDALIGIHGPRGETRVSLPDLYAALIRGDVEAYTGQRPHQADPWHVFTVQVAASILARNASVAPDDPPQDASFWRDGLLQLADGKATAWQLVVDDVTEPAFLQHPLSGTGDLAAFRPKAETPDQLDVLVTSKNHDVKMARARADDIESWLHALLSYQTTSGFLGAGNFGIVRMNGGFGSRPILSTVGSLRPPHRFREELVRVCALRAEVLAGQFGYRDRGVLLSWLEPWDRSGHQFTLRDLEPWFIEAARPVRLTRHPAGIVALGTTSQARQIGPKSLESGDVGDPWIPINAADKKKGRSALTVTSKGFDPKLLTDLLFEQNYELTELQRPAIGQRDLWFTGSALARGQGSTEGFHRFAIPIPERVRPRLFNREARRSLGERAEELLADAEVAQRALRTALLVMAEGGPEQANFGADTATAWADAVARDFSREWSGGYFAHLWRLADEDAAAVRAEWRRHLERLARRLLDSAESRLPLPHNRRWRALTRAGGAFAGSLRKKGWTPATEFDREEIVA